MRRLAGKHWASVAIIALLLLNVVLIVPLFMGRSNVPGGAVASPAGTRTVSPTQGSPSPSAGDVSSSASNSILKPGQPRRLLAMASEQIAWRAEPADCGHTSKIEVTTDGGKTWRVTDAGLKSVVRLKAFGGSSVFAIGADKNCKPAYAMAASPDASWHRDDSVLPGTWFRMPGALNTVHDPQDNTSQPCGKDGLVDLAGLGTQQAAALCGDGKLRIRDGGAGWHTAVRKSRGIALNADNPRFVMAQVRGTCDGVAVQAFSLGDNNVSTQKRHCLKGALNNSDSVAVSNRLGTIMVWSGDQVTVKP